jgi:hypothetical protein
MRIDSSVLSVSWIPSEAVTGLPKSIFEAGVTHCDDPPPDVVNDVEELRTADRFRFANVLDAWIDVADGRIVDAGYSGRGRIGSTTVRLAGRSATLEAVPLPDIQRAPEVNATKARFVQTAGGRTAVPAPRHVKHPPFFQLAAPTAWTTLALTIRTDGTSAFELVGASRFPRHWIYDAEGKLAAKAGLTDFRAWYRNAFGKHTPWGDEESTTYVTAVETALERRLSTIIMRGDEKPTIRSVEANHLLAEQGAAGDELFLLLDGVVDIVVDREPIAEVGPGAILGERAVLEDGRRTATLHARTQCRVAVASSDQIDRAALAELSAGHRREETASGS